MDVQHRLLSRQLRKHFGGCDAVPEEWRAFVHEVDLAYQGSDSDREMLERSLGLLDSVVRHKIVRLPAKV